VPIADRDPRPAEVDASELDIAIELALRHDPRVTLIEKFTEGGWVTTVITASLVDDLLSDPQPLRAVGARSPSYRSSSSSIAVAGDPARAGSSSIPRSRPRSCSRAASAVSGCHRAADPRCFGPVRQVVFVSVRVLDAGVLKARTRYDAAR